VIASSGRIDLREALACAADNRPVVGGKVEGAERMSIGRIASAATRGEAILVVTWDDGHRAEIDLAPLIAARRPLAPLADPETFHRIRLAEDSWSIEWPACGIDLGAAQLRRWADEQAVLSSSKGMPAPAFRAWIDRHAFTLDRAAEACPELVEGPSRSS
jgi:hypothetical protein